VTKILSFTFDFPSNPENKRILQKAVGIIFLKFYHETSFNCNKWLSIVDGVHSQRRFNGAIEVLFLYFIYFLNKLCIKNILGVPPNHKISSKSMQ